MREKIFRKKSLEKIKSPEALDDYIQVTNPGIWILLISVTVLLAGACIWGIFGRIDSTVPAAVHIENGVAICYISEDNISSVQVGITVKFADFTATITAIGENTEKKYECSLLCEGSPADGFYEGKAVIKSYKPLSFILN